MMVKAIQTSSEPATDFIWGRRKHFQDHLISIPLSDSVNGRERLGEPDCVAVVVFSSYAKDPRPRREAEALVKAGFQVDAISLRFDRSDPARETINGVNVVRAPLKHRRGGKLRYLLEYGCFFFFAFFL